MPKLAASACTRAMRDTFPITICKLGQSPHKLTEDLACKKSIYGDSPKVTGIKSLCKAYCSFKGNEHILLPAEILGDHNNLLQGNAGRHGRFIVLCCFFPSVQYRNVVGKVVAL